MDSHYFIAHTARARCAAGWFKLMGRQLVPLSALHWTLLEDQLGDSILSAELSLLELEVISRICASALPVADFSDPDAEELAARAEKSRGFNLEAERLAWESYFFACYGARPPLKELIPGTGKSPDSAVPVELYCIAALLSGAQGVVVEGHLAAIRSGLAGITRRELWEEMPVAEVLWLYEAMREQRDGMSYIEQPDIAPVRTEADDKLDALVNVIMGRHFGAVARANGSAAHLGTLAERLAHAAPAIAAADSERDRLIALAEAGRLADDLTELAAPATSAAPGDEQKGDAHA